MSKQPSFFDRDPNRPPPTFNRMREILEQRTGKPMESICNQAVTAPSDAGLDAPTPRGSLPNSLGASLTWGEPIRNADGTGYVKALEAPYTVSKAFVDGTALYSAFYEQSPLEHACGALDGAKDIARKDWQNRQTAKPPETT